MANGETKGAQPGHPPSFLPPSIPRLLPPESPEESGDVPYLVKQYPFKIATTNDDEWMVGWRCPGTYRCRAVDGKQLAFLELPSWSECVCVSDTNRGSMID